MKRLYSLAVAMGTAVLASAQLTGLTTETVVVHDGSIPELSGYTTYRVYAELTDSLDFVSAVYADDTAPLFIGCDGCSFFQSAPGGVEYDLGSGIDTNFFEFFPSLEYDSWLTIGSEDVGGGNAISVVGDALNDGLDLFNQGLGFSIDDAFGGSWFNTFPCNEDQLPDSLSLAECAEGNPAFAGEDNRVLLAQLTANGDIYGILNVQVFPGGDQDNDQKAEDLPFSSEGTTEFGCTDDAADNYNPDATADDGSCVYPCSLSMSLDEVVAPSCFGENDASFDVVATGAQGADWFFLDSIPAGAYDAPTAYGGQNFGNFDDALSGNYTVLVFDGAGCTDTLEVEVPVTPAIEATAVLTSGVSCAGDSDAVLTLDTVSGGNGGYEYSLSFDPELTQEPIWDSLPGDIEPYVTVFDSLGCEGLSNIVQITDPTPIDVGYANLTAENSVSDATCSYTMDGQIVLSAFGGSAPATIKYSVDGENYFDSPLMVSGGTYTVTARDINGCIGTMDEIVEVGPDAIEVTATSTPETCVDADDGEIEILATGGGDDFTYLMDGETVNSPIEGLAPGSYVVTVTDFVNDSTSCEATATVDVAAAVPVEVTATATDALCFGGNDGEVVVSATGGDGNFDFSDNGNLYGQNNIFDGLEAGNYTFYAQDGNGCTGQSAVVVGEGDEILVTGIASQGSVNGEGTIQLTVLGGTPGYTYEWTGEGVFGQTGQILENLSTGTYTVEVTDDNGCSAEEEFSITTINSVQEIAAGVVAKVYPNPSQGLFVIEIEGGNSGEIAYHVLDARGRAVTTGQWVSTAGMFRTVVDMTGAEAGLYRLVLMSEGHRSSIQMVKMD